MKICIKRASIDNIKDVSKLFNAYRVFYDQKSDDDLAHNFISDRLKNNESVIFTAHDEKDNYLGFTQLYPSFSSVSAKRNWVLNDLYVAEEARRLGIAKILMDKAQEFAIETNAKCIALETAIDNNGAQKLYESLGYKKGVGVYHYFLSLGSVSDKPWL